MQFHEVMSNFAQLGNSLETDHESGWAKNGVLHARMNHCAETIMGMLNEWHHNYLYSDDLKTIRAKYQPDRIELEIGILLNDTKSHVEKFFGGSRQEHDSRPPGL